MGTLRIGRVQHALIVAFLFFVACPAYGSSDELASLDIEDLMKVDVVTASRRSESLTQVAGAVYVMDEDDIFHSGATTIPEVLKFIPGIHAAQMDLDKWAMGVRGFSGILGNKHLVLIDGRPITSPTTAGVSWEHSIPLSIVKRIEFAQGTWTHLWGVESFTGVINIITKRAAETQGGLSETVVGMSGVEQLLRFGGEAGDSGQYRIYAKGAYNNRGWTNEEEDKRSSTNWKRRQVGTRFDWENAYTDTLTFDGNVSFSSIKDGAIGNGHIYYPHKRETVNGYAQFSWDRALGLGSNVKFRASYARDEINVDDLSGATNTIDTEIQHAAEQSGVHRLTWGIGGRYYWDTLESGKNTSIDQRNRYTFNGNGYVQDRVTLQEDSLYLFLGAKVDYLGRTPFEIQPTIRLLHTETDEEMWLAVSQAVRTDTRWQRSGSYSIRIGKNEYTVNPPDALSTEKLISYEAGYRKRVSSDVRWDTTLYVNDYDELVRLEYDSSTKTATLNNSLGGTAYGAETLLEWEAADWMTLIPSVGLVYQEIQGIDKSPEGGSMPDAGLTSILKLQTRLKPVQNAGFDFFVGYTDGPEERNLPGFMALEAHAYYRASETVMLELIGRNMSEAFDESSTLRVGPSVDLRLTWEF